MLEVRMLKYKQEQHLPGGLRQTFIIRSHRGAVLAKGRYGAKDRPVRAKTSKTRKHNSRMEVHGFSRAENACIQTALKALKGIFPGRSGLLARTFEGSENYGL
jgi:hypothetical protein